MIKGKKDLSDAGRKALETEINRPCSQCVRRKESASIGSCNYSKADFLHTCFVRNRAYPKKKEEAV